QASGAASAGALRRLLPKKTANRTKSDGCAMRLIHHSPFRGDPPEWIVADELVPCPYLPGQAACFPLRVPARRLRPAEWAQRLAAGDRRQGFLLYRPSCPSCRACQAIRIQVDRFQPGKTQRRVFRHGEGLLQTTIGAPTLTAEK